MIYDWDKEHSVSYFIAYGKKSKKQVIRLHKNAADQALL